MDRFLIFQPRGSCWLQPTLVLPETDSVRSPSSIENLPIERPSFGHLWLTRLPEKDPSRRDKAIVLDWKFQYLPLQVFLLTQILACIHLFRLSERSRVACCWILSFAALFCQTFHPRVPPCPHWICLDRWGGYHPETANLSYPIQFH